MKTMRLCDKCNDIFVTDATACSKLNCRGVLVAVDEPLIPIIQELRNKGYRTLFSCSGHIHSRSLRAGYITFAENYELDVYPEQFTIERGPLLVHGYCDSELKSAKQYGSMLLTLRGPKSEDTTSIGRNMNITLGIASLTDWVLKLKENKAE